ncbi:MAG: PIN domain-containing protein [Acidobacteriota bacterium]|nr:PIN domain-containing protein [Acidobacteriota bacterium]
MERRLILDTSGLIAYERETIRRAQFADDDVVVAAISIAEFRVGAEHADTPERRDRRLDILADIRATVDVLDYTEATAVEHAKLLAFVQRTGRPRGLHDLIIAAHAAEKNRTIVTADAAARFGDLPGVAAITPTR